MLNGGSLQDVAPPPSIKTTTTLTANSTISGPFRMTFDSSGSFSNSGGNSTLTSSITNATNAANYILNANGNGITLNPQLLTIACPVYLSESNSQSRTMTINGSGLTNISGVIHNNGTTDSGLVSNLTYNGTGILEVSNALQRLHRQHDRQQRRVALEHHERAPNRDPRSQHGERLGLQRRKHLHRRRTVRLGQ